MTQSAKPELCVQRDLDSLCRAAVEGLVVLAKQAVEARGSFLLALCGGMTIRPFLGLLADEYRGDVPWSQTHLFWSDERYVSPEEEESNYGAAKRLLLDHIEIPGENVHPMPVLLPTPEEAAAAYEEEVTRHFGGLLPRFDLMVMGMGPDGHTASLFPHSWALDEESRIVVAIEDSPKPPPVRLTMTFPVFNNAETIFFLVSGAEKHEMLERVIARPEDKASYPASAIHPTDGVVMWWVDEAAFGVGKQRAA